MEAVDKFGIGQPVRRKEDQRLLTGRGTFTDDGMAPWPWTMALGDTAESRNLLDEAITANGHVAAFPIRREAAPGQTSRVL